MKILHLANHCHEIGNGIMNVAVDLACEQSGMGHEVSFASAGGSFTSLLSRHGVPHRLVRQHWRRPSALLSSPLALHRVLATAKPDIVHAHMVAGALLARTLQFAHTYGLVTTVHNEWQRSAPLMGVGGRVIAVSAAVAAKMAKRGIAPGKIKVVLNGPLGTPRHAFRDGTSSVSLRRPSIMTLCGLYQRKGVADLIAAFEQIGMSFPDAHLYIVGDGPDKEAFVAQASRSSCSQRIIFAGFQPDPRPYLAQADIFVLASRSEPFGLVLAEAREAGCAVIGTDVGGIPEVLEHGAAGLLTPPQQHERLASLLAGLLGDPDRLGQWQGRARRNLAWLTTDRAARNTIAVYEELLSAQSSLGAEIRSVRPQILRGLGD